MHTAGMQPSGAPVDPTLFALGDIGVGRVWVATPSGSAPMNGSTFYLQEAVYTEEKMPQWALIAAIVGFVFICVFSLFFLMVKEKTVTGYVDVTVINGEFRHLSRIPITTPFQLDQIRRQVADAQQMAAVAPAAG